MNKLKIFMRRLSWNIWAGLQCHHKCFYKRGAEGDRETQKEEGNMIKEPEIGVMSP